MNKKEMMKFVILSVVIIVMLMANIGMSRRSVKVEFVPPEFDSMAMAGTPEAPEELDYNKLYQEGMNYTAYICGVVKQENGAAVVYFTNPEENEAWLKLRIFDEEGHMLGESGLIKSGEYLRAIPLDKELAAGTPIRMKVMGYEPDTYLSMGAVTINTVIAQ